MIEIVKVYTFLYDANKKLFIFKYV